jgi:hypothetical protein
LVNRKTIMDYPCNGVQDIVLNMWKDLENALFPAPLDRERLE